MIPQAAPVFALRDNFEAKRLASLYLFTLADGTFRQFTDHDASIEYGGLVYTPRGGFTPTARRFQDGLRPASVDFNGPITASGVTADDLRAGLYREAQVIEAVVDWRYPFAGPYVSHYWWVEQVTYDAEKFALELAGPERFMRRRVGATISRNCARKLGDTRCAVNLAGFTTTGVIAEGTDDGDKRLVLVATSGSIGAFSDEYFTGGTVECTAGANAGLSREVRSYRADDRRFSLQVPFPFDIAAGDTFDVTAGCDKTFTTCSTKFTNSANYGGFRFMPGSDRVLQTPRRR